MIEENHEHNENHEHHEHHAESVHHENHEHHEHSENHIHHDDLNKEVDELELAEKIELTRTEVSSVVSSVVETPNHAKNYKRWLFLGGTIVVTVVLLLVAVLSIAVYSFGANTSFVQKVLRVVPLPAAVVSGHIIPYADYLGDFNAIKTFQTAQKLRDPEYAVMTDAEIKDILKEKLLNRVIFRDLAKKYQVALTKEEVNNQFDQIAAGVPEGQTIEGFLQENFHWTVEEYKDRIIFPVMLEGKVAENIVLSGKTDDQARAKALKILEEVKTGAKSFADYAKEYSEEPNASETGGDLGYFTLDLMVPEFSDAVAKLSVGQVSDLVISRFGFHIVKLEDKRVTTPAEESTAETVNTEVVTAEPVDEYKASHILIQTKTFDQFFAEYKDSLRIWQFFR